MTQLNPPASSAAEPLKKTHPKYKVDLSRLNAEQRKAVLHTEGPLLILAGAGSGKTSTMTHRIAHLIADKSVSAKNILGLSFTNKAATELKERVNGLVGKVLGKSATQGLIVSTFHSLCVRVLREYAPRIGYSSTFSILDPHDQESIVREVLKYVKIDEKKFDPSWILFQIGQAKNKFLSGDDAQLFFDQLKGPKVSYDDYSIAVQSVFPRYQERLKLQNSMDFDDLLFNAVTLLETCPDVREILSRRFRYIMVDEYQDTNPSQFRLLQALTCSHSNICVVGDDDQSIYAWRGADPAHILHFDRSFPGTSKIILSQNYRSTEMILKAANEVIAKNQKRYPKSLWSERGTGSPLHLIAVEDDRAEAQFVMDEILKKTRGAAGAVSETFTPETAAPIDYKRFAILFRANAQSRIFEEALRLHQIPYKLVGAMSFLDRKEVKDLLCYWKLVQNPNDDAALRRIINWPARGIGKASLQLAHEFSVQNGVSFFQALNSPEIQAQLTDRAKSGIERFKVLIESMRTDLEKITCEDPQYLTLVSEWAKRTLDQIGMKTALLDDEEDPVKAQKRYENIEELASAIGMMEAQDHFKSGVDVLQEYLGQLILNSKEDKEEDQSGKNALTLITLHGSKGLEFPIVFLVGLEDGYLPHQRTIDEGTDLSEERRLFYVGMTRAQDELYLIRSKHRVRYGKPVPRNPSRFLSDIPAELTLERDESSTPEFKSEEALRKHEEEVTNFFEEIKNRLKKN